ncbi:MAG: CopD family protein [Gammaproteobacteria bacterium]|nr:CopD family protein [Gammaproteobacteria bacterium]
MAWIKTFHIVFVVSWFAGLLYLPRLYVYHSTTTDALGHERFLIMERKLFILMTIAAALASVFGIWLVVIVPAFLAYGWLHAKLGLCVLLLAYHWQCSRLNKDFRLNNNRHSHVWYRWFNEAPAVLLIGIVALVVVKPF